jgi:hypothetical protein
MHRFALCAVAALATVLASAAVAAADTRVSVGAPLGTTVFSQNKQNEPALAVDAHQSNVLVAGANDEIDMEGCAALDEGEDPPGSQCPFTPGVGTSGVYFSFDGGHHWRQPTYTGNTARHCVTPDPCEVKTGPIGTLPWYSENGLVSDGDPAVAFGPRRGANGKFDWGNGSRLYYANLTSGAVKGFEAIGVSRTDDVATASLGGTAGKNAWKAPVLVSKQSSTLFSDKEQVWADNASSSKYFGNVYICYAAYRSQEKGNAIPEPIIVARSTDGGDTWSTKQVSSAQLNGNNPGRDGCTVRTDSTGNVYVFFRANDPKSKAPSELMVRSTNGGTSWSPARRVSGPAVTVGLLDPTILRPVEDGLAGARADLAPAPSVDIANGAPDGAGATNEIVMAWVDGSQGINNERALFAYSRNGGSSFTGPATIPVPGRPYYVAPAIAPDGSQLYLSYNAYTDPYRDNTSDPRGLVGGMMTSGVSGGGAAAGWSVFDQGTQGDPRGSSQNNLMAEFLGDYVYAVATRTYGAAVYNDVRNADDCTAEDTYRQKYEEGVIAGDLPPVAQEDSPAEANAPDGGDADADAAAAAPTRPSIPTQCTPSFGDSDIYGTTSAP